MSKATITIQTDTMLKQKAKAFFNEQGINLEDAVRLYLSDMIGERKEDPVKLYEVADEDISAEELEKMAWVDQLPKEDFFIHSEQQCAS